MRGKKLHSDELDIDIDLVRRLVVTQFPHLAEMAMNEVDSVGTVNAIYRLGNDLCNMLRESGVLPK